MAQVKHYTVKDGKIPSGLKKEFDGKKEKVGQITGLRDIGKLLRKTAKRGIQNSPKVGNRYYYKGLGYTRASLPGAYPADQTGNLRRSVGYRVPNSSKLIFGARAEYAKYLQQSDSPDGRKRAGGRIAERPFLTNAHNQVKNRFKKIMANNILSEVK